ncbi:MAG TPA: DNA repair protein RecO [Polyangia bacterium]|nr:DNA repair protein RecO [Polyangia bacterium]
MIGRVDSFETQAVVVRVVDYGEADRILTLLTRNHGKLGVIARGARRSRRRFGPSLGLFAVGAATVRERRGAELALLTGWAPLSDPQGLASDVARMAHAGYVCEAARELSAARHADPEVFDLVVETLGVLAAADRPARAETLRIFEIRLLDALGFGPVLDRCVACGATELPGGPYVFDLGSGGIVCGHCHGVGPELPEAARRALLEARTLTPAGGAALVLDANINAACREALGAAILHHLGRPLRSLEFIAKVRKTP